MNVVPIAVEHHEALRKPLDATEFITAMQEEMRPELEAPHTAPPRSEWLEITDVDGRDDRADPFRVDTSAGERELYPRTQHLRQGRAIGGLRGSPCGAANHREKPSPRRGSNAAVRR
ncbi:hypothetical protein [Mycobacterium sp.]|uniref:hypothetical protein n=1 Tax=Mycobacterium sp. TaxID=1785 RepID=UPI0031CEC6E2